MRVPVIIHLLEFLHVGACASHQSAHVRLPYTLSINQQINQAPRVARIRTHGTSYHGGHHQRHLTVNTRAVECNPVQKRDISVSLVARDENLRWQTRNQSEIGRVIASRLSHAHAWT